MFTEEFKKKDYLDLGGKKKANVDHILVRDYVREIDIGAFQYGGMVGEQLQRYGKDNRGHSIVWRIQFDQLD